MDLLRTNHVKLLLFSSKRGWQDRGEEVDICFDFAKVLNVSKHSHKPARKKNGLEDWEINWSDSVREE